MLISCKPADLYLQYPHLFWKKSKCPLNWAGGQHNLPILFVTMKLMVGLALNLLVTSFTWRCLFGTDNSNGLVFPVAGPWLGASASAGRQSGDRATWLWRQTMVGAEISPKPCSVYPVPAERSWASGLSSLTLSVLVQKGHTTYFAQDWQRLNKRNAPSPSTH